MSLDSRATTDNDTPRDDFRLSSAKKKKKKKKKKISNNDGLLTKRSERFGNDGSGN